MHDPLNLDRLNRHIRMAIKAGAKVIDGNIVVNTDWSTMTISDLAEFSSPEMSGDMIVAIVVNELQFTSWTKESIKRAIKQTTPLHSKSVRSKMICVAMDLLSKSILSFDEICQLIESNGGYANMYYGGCHVSD
ncbi:MAG: hypothetical protein WC284_12215 [Candidimonas sp.]